MRPREVWFYFGGGFLTAGAVLTAIAIAYFTKEPTYSLSTGPQMVAAYVTFGLAAGCFFAAVVGWRPWLRWQRFPNITIRVDKIGDQIESVLIPGFPPRPTRFHILGIHITNAEADRNVSIRAAYLQARTKPGSTQYEHTFTEPHDKVVYSNPIQALDFPINLAPGEASSGDLVYQMSDYLLPNLAAPMDARIEIHDALSGKMASFPAAMDVYRRGRGLRSATYAERVNGPNMSQPWYGVMGPPDP
jgi:hypothetical protein